MVCADRSSSARSPSRPTGLVILSRRDPVSADNVIEMQMELPSPGHRPGGGGGDMIFATLSDYIDLTALWKIGVVVLLASVLVPRRVLRRHRRRGAPREAAAHQETSAAGLLMLAFGGVVCAAAIALGIWAMLQK